LRTNSDRKLRIFARFDRFWAKSRLFAISSQHSTSSGLDERAALMTDAIMPLTYSALVHLQGFVVVLGQCV
jgi:hypothetical protein